VVTSGTLKQSLEELDELEYMSASANQFHDGSAANSANLPFFSELSCFWTRRASQDTKKGSLVTLIPATYYG